MLLVDCPECGRGVSDKASACPHCDHPNEESAVTAAGAEPKRISYRHGLIAAAVVLVMAFALNPSFDQHKAKIKDSMAERDPVASLFGAGKLTAWAST